MAANPKVKIKLSQSIGGHRTRFNHDTRKVEVIGIFAYNPGDVIEWDAKEAQKYIEAGIATPAE